VYIQQGNLTIQSGRLYQQTLIIPTSGNYFGPYADVMIFTNTTGASVIKLNGSTMTNGYKFVCRLGAGTLILSASPDTGYTMRDNVTNAVTTSLTFPSLSFLYYNSVFFQL
jgi:hypothetical protein